VFVDFAGLRCLRVLLFDPYNLRILGGV